MSIAIVLAVLAVLSIAADAIIDWCGEVPDA